SGPREVSQIHFEGTENSTNKAHQHGGGRNRALGILHLFCQGGDPIKPNVSKSRQRGGGPESPEVVSRRVIKRLQRKQSTHAMKTKEKMESADEKRHYNDRFDSQQSFICTRGKTDSD